MLGLHRKDVAGTCSSGHHLSAAGAANSLARATGRECGNERRDFLKGNHKGWVKRVISSFPAAHQRVLLVVDLGPLSKSTIDTRAALLCLGKLALRVKDWLRGHKGCSGFDHLAVGSALRRGTLFGSEKKGK